MVTTSSLRYWAALSLSAACLVGCGRSMPLQATSAKVGVARAKSAEGIAQAIRAGIFSIWHILDKNKDQVLDRQEMEGIPDFQVMDVNQDQKISMEEMIMFTTSPEEIKKIQVKVKVSFQKSDKNQDSQLDLEEFIELIASKKIDKSEDRNQMAMFDLNRDGKLNLSETEDFTMAYSALITYALMDIFTNKKMKWTSTTSPQATR